MAPAALDLAQLVGRGNCILLATIVANKEPKEGRTFPLSVDYQEKIFLCGPCARLD
jgi:polyribonucleotide nucleotidyltransferase